MAPDLTPAQRVQPDPEHGWSGSDLHEDELVDEDFIAAFSSRVYDPLLPEDEKLY